MNIEWRPIPGIERYEASNTGLIRNGKRGNVIKPSLLKGYESVCIYDLVCGGTARRTVHRLVALAFLGADVRPIRHLDGNCLNNNVANLAYGTAKENSMDRDRHGTTQRGEAHYKAKLNAEIVARIRSFQSQGKGCAEIGRLVGLNRSRTHEVMKRVTWKHLP